ncbi:MAG: aminotransferase class IV [Gammaproteobacteria bacterium]
MNTVYLNGEFIPQNKALISVMDRGFLFGDGVYEVIPIYGGRLFRLSQHLQRLQNSLDGILLDNPHSNTQWETLLNQLLQANISDDLSQDYSIYLQITRGAIEKRDYRIPDTIKPTVFANCRKIPMPDKTVASHGISAITVEDIRWLRCDIKAITLLPNILLKQAAANAGADEAILIRDGYALEGSASNLFIISNGVIKTHPTGPLLLPGITRDLILELAEKQNIAHEETSITEKQLCLADEVWLTSSTREILAVTKINKTTIGNGKPGTMWKTMTGLYREYKETLRSVNPGIEQ